MKKNSKKFVGVITSFVFILTSIIAISTPANAAARLSDTQIKKAMDTPTNLTFWTWVPGIDKQIKLFEAKYPKIKVTAVNVGQGGPHYQKLRTGATSGSGLPDVAQVEFQYIPTFTQIGLLKDLSPYVSKDFKSKFPDWILSQISGSKREIWAVPQDSGPMGMLYRTDIFAKYNIKVPTTWAEFEAAAKKLNAADPKVYLTNFAPNEAGAFTGLAWQAGARPVVNRGPTTIQLRLNDANTTKVASYWANLVKSGAISADPAWNNDWYAGFNTGKYATWLTAAWGPLFLAGSAKDTSGKWRAAPLPQWKAGESISGNWGGSTSAVMKSSKNPIAAAVFAEFINTDSASALALASEPQFLFPATKATAVAPQFTSAKPDFFGGQEVNKLFGEINNTVAKDFQWSPFQDQIYTEWAVVGKAIAEKTDVLVALKTFQANVVKYAKDQGFTVRN